MKRGVWIIIGVVVVLIIGVIFFLNRNATPGVEPATLTVWSPFDEEETYQQISEGFLEANDHVTLNFKYIVASDAKDYEAQVVNAIANGDGPDIWLARNDWIPKHIDKSVPAIVDSQTDPIAFAKQSVLPNVVEMNTAGGKLYGAPMSADTLAIIYNTTLYDAWVNAVTDKTQQETARKFPTSWEDLKSQSTLLSQSRNGVVTRSAIALGTSSNTFTAADVLGAFLVQAGASILAEDGQSIVFNLPQTKSGVTKLPATDALNFYTSFAVASQPNFSWASNLGNPTQAFLDQKTGALIGYYSTLKEIVAKNPTFTIKVAPLVQLDPTATTRVDYGISWSHLVSKNSDNQTLAWTYLGYLINPKVTSQYSRATDRMPVTNTTISPLNDEIIPADVAGDQVFYRQLPTARSFVKPEWQFVDQALQDTINLVVTSSQAAQTAVDTVAAQFKKQFLSAE